MESLYPAAFARFYDILYQNLRDETDKQFFLDHIQETRGRILEVGTGTGRFFLDALMGGADIYGLDVSKAMIEVLLAKLKPEEQARISLQNIVDFRYDFQFGLVIAPFRVMMHVHEKEDQIRALDNVYEHLEPDGMFIFDAFVPDLRMLIEGLDQVTDFMGEYEPGKKLKRTVSTKPELISQLIHVNFDLEWEEEGEWKSETWNVPMRYFFRYELEHLVERSKFAEYKILGDYQGNRLQEGSKEFIVICQKH